MLTRVVPKMVFVPILTRKYEELLFIERRTINQTYTFAVYAGFRLQHNQKDISKYYYVLVR